MFGLGKKQQDFDTLIAEVNQFRNKLETVVDLGKQKEVELIENIEQAQADAEQRIKDINLKLENDVNFYSTEQQTVASARTFAEGILKAFTPKTLKSK